MLEVLVRRAGLLYTVAFTNRHVVGDYKEIARRMISEKGFRLEPGDIVIIKVGDYAEVYEVLPDGQWRLLASTLRGI